MSHPLVDASGASRAIQVLEGISPSAVRNLAALVKSQYLDLRLDSLSGRSYKEHWSQDSQTIELEWTFFPPWSGPQSGLEARFSAGPRLVSVDFPGLDPSNEPSMLACRRVADDLEFIVNAFFARAKGSSLYFVFSTGEKHAPRETPSAGSAGRDLLRRVVSGNMMNLYLLIITASFVLFLVVGDYAIVAVVVLQVLALFYSDRLALMSGKVRPTAEMPKVTVVSVPVTKETREFVAKQGRGLVSEINDRVEESVSGEASSGPGAVTAVQGALSRIGIKAAAEEITFVTRDVYGLVKGAADRFGLPVPKIAISGSVADNAAATGVSPGRSSIAITVGSLEDLEDDEFTSVVGHELGHIVGRDSLILFAVTFIMYFGGLFLWFPLLERLGLFYYIVAFAVIYSVGKVLETRADTESVAKLGAPTVLASALTKIGFRQLYRERYSSQARFFDWLSFDPHPPIYFRVQRLSKLAASGGLVGSVLLLSLKDLVSGFFRSIG